MIDPTSSWTSRYIAAMADPGHPTGEPGRFT